MAQIEKEGNKFRATFDTPKGPKAPGVQTYHDAQRKVFIERQDERSRLVALESSNKILNQQKGLLDYISNKQKELTKLGKDTSTLDESKLKTLERINEQHKIQANLARSYKQILSSMGNGFKESGMGGVKQVWQGMSGVEKIGFGATSIGGAIAALGSAADYIGRRPIDIARMQGSAISMTTGRQLGEARSGEYTYESMYGDARQKAQGQAASSRAWGTGGDIAKLIGGGIMAAGGIAAIAAAIPTGGMSLAALPGMAAGAGVAGLGAASFLSGAKVLDPQKYAAYRSQQEAQDFTTMLASLQDSGPYRKDAIERLKATGGRDLGMQRALGLNDSGYYGSSGYLQRQMNLGFTDEMITNASKGILGAGGSTQMALQSGTALQAERGLGLTNATGLLGQLSGTQSIPETSKKTLIDIFARGFDSSKYAEENGKYMEAVTDQIYKGGSTSVQSADRIADLIRASIGNAAPTTRNIEAGKSAFEAYSNSTTSLSGFAGGLNISSAMEDPLLRKITDTATLSGFLKLKPNEIDETDPDFISSAKAYGIDPAALAKTLRNRGQTLAQKQLGNHTRMGQRYMAGLVAHAEGAAAQKAYVNMVNPEYGPSQYGADMTAADAASKMGALDTGRAGDTMVQASAKNAQISLETLSQSISKFAEDAMKAAVKLGAEAPVGRQNEENARRDAQRLETIAAHTRSSNAMGHQGAAKVQNQTN